MDIIVDSMDVIEFNGVTSSSLGIVVDGYYTKGIPQRRVSTLSVPGRNGTIVEDEGVYENSVQEYTLYWLPEHTEDSEVLDWLKQDNYYSWKHSNNPGYHCFARAILPTQIINHRNCYHELTVTFNCMPEMYLDSGDEIVILQSSGVLNNPTLQLARPKIAVYGNTSSPQKLTVNDSVLTLNQIDGFTVLDCALQEAYKGSINKNNTISGEFPTFPGGTTSSISFTSGVVKVEIQPRWWTI